MVYRNSWLAGIAGLAFALYLLDDLILPTAEGVSWQYIVIASLALGVTITWTALTYRLKAWLVAVLNAAAALLAIVRVATPETTSFFLPTAESFSVLEDELTLAQDLIRRGVEPVVPEVGVIVVVMLVLWAVGGLMSWGLLRGHPYVALLPPLVLSLQFATMNRQPTGVWTIAGFIALVALIIFAVTADERDHTSGRMAPRGEWASHKNRPGPAAAALLGVTIAGSVFIVGAVDDTVPHDGLLDWRVDSGLPSDVYGGSLSYNPFIGIRQQIVNGSPTPAFLARIASDVPAGEVYFRFMTLENYDGTKFSVGASELRDVDDAVWEDPGHAFAGPTAPLATAVVIDQLRMQWLPTPAVPFSVQGEGTFDAYLQIRPQDAAVYYPGFTERGMTYRVDANIRRPDLNVLATLQEGPNAGQQLSVAFRNAADDPALSGATLPEPTPALLIRDEPPNARTYLDLPRADATARIADIETLAKDVTKNLETPFEKGVALEAFLRDPTVFSYTTSIQPGHGARDLAEWLLEPDSANYRTGYCENFSTAMAVMARTLGIHSRVVLGFTPGEPSLIQENVVIVRDRNAHAWVELWMPSQGWVRFDPTPRSDQINPSTGGLTEEQLGAAIEDLVLGIPDPEPVDAGGGPIVTLSFPPETLFPPGGGGGTDTPADAGFTVPEWARWAAPLVVLLLLVALGIPAVKIWRHRLRLRRLDHGDITAAWEDIVVRLGDLGRTVAPSHTPSEVAAGVDPTLEPLASVYGRAIYGPADGVASEDAITVARKSLDQTREHLAVGLTRRARVLSWYRPSGTRRRR